MGGCLYACDVYSENLLCPRKDLRFEAGVLNGFHHTLGHVRIMDCTLQLNGCRCGSSWCLARSTDSDKYLAVPAHVELFLGIIHLGVDHAISLKLCVYVYVCVCVCWSSGSGNFKGVGIHLLQGSEDSVATVLFAHHPSDLESNTNDQDVLPCQYVMVRQHRGERSVI